MEFVQFLNNVCGRFVSQNSSNIEMCILGDFLSSDVGCHNFIYKQWAMADKLDPNSEFWWTAGGNVTFMEEKEDGFIYLSSSVPLEEDEKLIEFKLTKEQFIKILDDWEQVSKLMPSEVIIKYENDKFIFETK